MTIQIIVKTFLESIFAKEPVPATQGSAGYDLFAAKAKTILPKECECISIDFRWSITKGFHGKIYPRSSSVKRMITIDAGLIDFDYREIVHMLVINHSDKAFTVRTGDRIAQVVFQKNFDAIFLRVTKKEFLGVTKRGEGGFGSTDTTIEAKKSKIIDEQQKSFDESVSTLTNFGKSGVLQIGEKDDLEIIEEEAIMKVGDETVLYEKVTIDDWPLDDSKSVSADRCFFVRLFFWLLYD